ncbi:MAG: hypothetical protein NUV82_03240 [Candidatus Komeilibacteria bacterium]|nr:hypothetical protein [Candidatus Komeilibacteria bacterium]
MEIVVVLAALLLIISTLSYLGYPLLWNDEADTAMFGRSIQEHGYPKPKLGANTLYHMPHPDLTLGVKESIDAFIPHGWAQYYIAAAADKLTNLSDQLHIKTALLRLPFALIGITGIFLLALLITKVFASRKQKFIGAILFLTLVLLTPNIALHLREVRYYPLVIFLIGYLSFLFYKIYIEEKVNTGLYKWLLVFALWLLYNTFAPVFFIFVATAAIWLFYLWLQDYLTSKNWKRSWIRQWPRWWPWLTSLISGLPLLWLYETFFIARVTAQQFNFGFSDYLDNIGAIITFLSQTGSLYLLIVTVAITLILKFREHQVWNSAEKLFLFLCLLFAVYLLGIARIPFLFERYFIELRLLILIIISLSIVINIQQLNKIGSQSFNKIAYATMIGVLILLGVLLRWEYISGYWSQLTNRYYGPTGYAVKYLKSVYQDPSDLIIATNYEEQVYMYYLKSRVIVGYVGNNLAEDRGLSPDVIIYRRDWTGHEDIFTDYLEKDDYRVISLPIMDYKYNNIAESCCHLYTSPLTRDYNKQLKIFLRQ